MSERTEALMRIVVGIVSGIILSVWRIIVQVFAIVNLVITLVTGKRNEELAEFCEVWNTQVYTFLSYMTFVNNKRPFPFVSLRKSFVKFEKK